MNKKSVLFVVITALLFASMEPVSKMLTGLVPPLNVTFLRFLLGAVVLLPFAFYVIITKKIRFQIKDIVMFGIVGALGIGLSMGLFQFAIEMNKASSTTAIIFCTNPLFTAPFAHFILGEKITWQKIAAMSLSTVGIVFFLDFSNISGSLSGIILAFGSAISFALYSVLGKKYLSKHGSIIQNCFSFFAGCIVLFIFIAVRGENPFEGFTSASLPQLLYLGIVVSGVGYICYFLAMIHGSATTASYAFYLKPALAPFFSLLILGEQIKPMAIAGLIFVIAGAVINIFMKESKTDDIFGKENGDTNCIPSGAN